jgi:hypothetical protein
VPLSCHLAAQSDEHSPLGKGNSDLSEVIVIAATDSIFGRHQFESLCQYFHAAGTPFQRKEDCVEVREAT